MEKPLILRASAVKRLKKNHYESIYWSEQLFVCGLDEAGRGPLAGPLVTAAVILPLHTKYALLKDSKCMTAQEREKAFAWIKRHAWYGIGIVPSHRIDAVNIWHATLLGMRRAVLQLMSTAPMKPGAFLVDAMPLSLSGTVYAEIPVHAFVFGESVSSSVAAASIVAKVVRDRIMTNMDPLFPFYQLEQHKGYCTLLHRELVKKYGRSLAHRIHYRALIEEHMLKEPNDIIHQHKLC
jgi:ribonuclease HII